VHLVEKLLVADVAVVVVAVCMHILKLPFLSVLLILQNLVSSLEDHNSKGHLEVTKLLWSI
jgi:hypothetical protein